LPDTTYTFVGVNSNDGEVVTAGAGWTFIAFGKRRIPRRYGTVSIVS
jgi:hypothetical protein